MGQRFGQHFLSSPGILNRIAREVCAHSAENVVEIGPGRGALTEKLIGCAGHVTAIEIDPQLAVHLRAKFHAVPNLEIITGDALEVDFGAWYPSAVAGNLPYYVATAIIERTIRLGLPAVFLIQKEVAQRLAATPSSRDYGFLTVQTQLFSRPEILFNVSPGAFHPPPKVESAVVRLTPSHRATDLAIHDIEGFLQFLGTCFRHKRKTLKNNLRAEFPIETEPEGNSRAEQLTLDQFAGLWKRLQRPATS